MLDGKQRQKATTFTLLQGWDEIMRLKDLLEAIGRFGARHQVLPLHSMVPAADQRRVFLRPPAGVRKVRRADLRAEPSTLSLIPTKAACAS